MIKFFKTINPNECIIEVVGFDNLLVDHAKKSGAKVLSED